MDIRRYDCAALAWEAAHTIELDKIGNDLDLYNRIMERFEWSRRLDDVLFPIAATQMTLEDIRACR